MSSKPIYIGIISTLAIALIITVAIIIGNSGNDNTNLNSNVAPGNKFDSPTFDNDTTFPSTVGETLTMSVNVNNNYVVGGNENDIYVKLDFKAMEYKFKEDMPLNLSLVLDKSGSMTGEKIEQAKEALIGLIKSLSPEDMVSIVTYDDGVNIVYQQSSIDSLEQLIQVVNNIYGGGGTYLEGGLREGIKQVVTRKSDDYINRVILFSDGVATNGITDAEGLGRVAAGGSEQGVSISTMGFGTDYDEKVMTSIAINGSGNYQYIRYAEDIPKSLKEELSMLKSTVASQTKVKVIHDPSIRFIRTFGYRYESKNGYVEIPIRDFFSGDKGKAILHFKTDAKDLSDPNIKITLNYIDAVNDRKEENYDTGVALSVTDSMEMYNDNLNTTVMSEVLSLESTVALEEANQAFEKGDKDQALDIIQSYINNNKDFITTYGENEEVNQTIDYLNEQQKELETVEYGEAEAKHYLKSNRSVNMYKMQGRAPDDDTDNEEDDEDDED
jgi:Ca-activated chloride channel homolog